MDVKYLSDKYPAGDLSDGQYLYRSLGSFWTYIFQDKNAIKGYTLGMAEELIQAYMKLTEVIDQYSVKDINPYHHEKWKALTIKKSEYNQAPFKFEPSSAVFGPQPESDKFYRGEVFRFGFPKETAEGVYSFTPSFKITDFGAISDRIIAPKLVLVPGVDVVLDNGTLYFNADIFNNPILPKIKLIDDFGVPITYVDASDNVVEDEMIVLWLSNSVQDNDELYRNFGTLFELRLESSEAYKEILKCLINLYVEGPTIQALNLIFAALNEIPVTDNEGEIVENIQSDKLYTYIVTDKTVYRVSPNTELNPVVKLRASLPAGTILTSAMKIIDCVIDPVWWKTEISSPQLGFASHVFAASVDNQLFFENKLSAITYSEGILNFPVNGRREDVQAFQDYINIESNKAEILSKLGIAGQGPAVLGINPVDFVFSNIFKNNTLLLKLNFNSDMQLHRFFDLFNVVQTVLPPHVYVISYIRLQLPQDEIDFLNFGIQIPGYSGVFSADGSVSDTGERPGSPSTDTEYYKDYLGRMFCVSVGPYADNGLPLHDAANLDYIRINTTLPDGLPSGIPSSAAVIQDGGLMEEIPLSVQPPGEGEPRTPSTREIPTIFLIDF